MGVRLRPHTIDWFLRLEVTDPRLFEIVNRTIDHQDDLCGFCGTGPAADYEILHPTPPTHHVATFRLCQKCVDFRRQTGELLAPWPRSMKSNDD